jgi:hypothetical protein
MQRVHFAVAVSLMFIVVALAGFPSQVAPSTHTGAVTPHSDVPTAPSAGTTVSPALGPVPQTTYPRTVLVETFTGVWCPHCPAETEALHSIDELQNRSYVIIAELHQCAFAPGQGPCLDNYVPPDNTTDYRGVFYNVCGYPDVFFDGLHDACGATNSQSQMENTYNDTIANASRYPGNVSISQSANVGTSMITSHAYITSGLTGSYNAVTYLMEYIGKLGVNNGGGPHDIDNVVRATMVNHPVQLTAGQTTEFDGSVPLNTSWNQLNLSVITLVQQNSTRIVENANMTPVSVMRTSVGSNESTLISGTKSAIMVQVDSFSTGLPISGATVTLSSDSGGSFSPATGVTGADGSFSSNFTAPPVQTSETVVITAQVNATGLGSTTSQTTLLVTPVVLPLAPTNLLVGPGSENVTLNWTAPASGSSGLTYHIYRSTSAQGAYSEIGTATVPPYEDSSVIGATSYWYSVSAQDSFGFSPNSTAAPATALTVKTQGLPTTLGWWISVGTQTFRATSSDAQYLFFPSGVFSYQFGPGSYAYEASESSGTFTASGTSLTLSLAFAPRYANLQGTVSPAGATVTVNGTPLAVSDGSFSDLLIAGQYSITVTASGYVSNTSTWVLTPGNLTSVHVALDPVPGSSSSSGIGGLSTTDAIIIIAGVVGIAAIVIAGVALRGRGRGPRHG